MQGPLYSRCSHVKSGAADSVVSADVPPGRCAEVQIANDMDC